MSFLRFVENRLIDCPGDRVKKSAAASFLEAFAMLKCDSVTEESLRGWIAIMITSGLNPNSRRKYLGVIGALYRDWTNATDNGEGPNPFTTVINPTNDDIGIKKSETNIETARRLLNIDSCSADHETISIFLYLLFDIEAQPEDIIRLKFGDVVPPLPQLADIIETMRISKRKKYVFGLGQGKKREGQIAHDLLHNLAAITAKYGFDFGGEFSTDSITAIWIAAAFKAGIPITEVRSMVRNIPKEYFHLQYIKPIQLSPDVRLNIMRKVADSIHDKTAQWFVMRLRQGNTPDDIKGAIKAISESLYNGMAFYYPSHTVITVDSNGRRKKEEQPYLPGILFFKLRRDKVASLFRHIGNLAWGYKYTNSPGSPYCTIPINEMKTFQQHIGLFTPDVKMELVTLDAPLHVEQKVKIIGGGIMEEQIGIVKSIRHTNGTRTYTLALSSREYAIWTVNDIEEIYIEPVSD